MMEPIGNKAADETVKTEKVVPTPERYPNKFPPIGSADVTKSEQDQTFAVPPAAK